MVKPYLSSVCKNKEGLFASWETVHSQMAGKSAVAQLPAELLGYAIYYYTVYTAFGEPTDIARSRELVQLLQWRQAATARPAWSAALLDQAVALAWLHAQLSQHPGTPAGAATEMAALDTELLAEAGLLRQQARAEIRPQFLRIARYFCLRRTTGLLPSYWEQMTQLLAELVGEQKTSFWFPYFDPTRKPDPYDHITPLGLTNGLAGELLLLMQLYQADSRLAGLKELVRQGILYVLSTKREVDFSEQKYAIFPSQVVGLQQEATFDNVLSWNHGDMGQALLLYKGYELLQDTELLRLAELVGLNTLLRTDVRSTAVTTSGFGAGAAGVAHLYGKLAQVSQHEAYLKGYAFWLAQTRSWLPHELQNNVYRPREADVLHGLVGVGLVLLSAISEKDLGWDQFLL